MTVQITVPTRDAVEALYERVLVANQDVKAAQSLLSSAVGIAESDNAPESLTLVGGAFMALRRAESAVDQARDAWLSAKRLRDTYAGGAS